MRRMRVAASGALACLITAALPAMAQQRNPLLVASEPAKFMIPLCPLRASGKAEDGQKELKQGIEHADAAKRAAALQKAEAILTAAVAGQDAGNPAAWYYLARTYIAQGDLAGADSAFTKVEQMVPDCELDTRQYRQNAWLTLANAGIELRQREQDQEAMTQFRDATRIFRSLPHVYQNMGLLFANTATYDSAAIYFGKALETSEADSTLVEIRNSSALNRALMLQRLGQHQEAVQLLDRLLTWNPTDIDGKRAKARSLRALEREAEAQAVEGEVATLLSAMNLDSLSLDDLMDVGVNYFNNGDYTSAASIFERAAARHPWSRDAVYNLAYALAMATNALDSSQAPQAEGVKRKLTETSKRLVDIEPLNEDTYRFAARGYRGRRQDSLELVAEQLMALPVNLEVTQFALLRTGARWTALATGRAAVNAAGSPIPASPLTLVLEFLDDSAKVVRSQEVSFPALEPGKTQELSAEAEGLRITSWRYRRK